MVGVAMKMGCVMVAIVAIGIAPSLWANRFVFEQSKDLGSIGGVKVTLAKSLNQDDENNNVLSSIRASKISNLCGMFSIFHLIQDIQNTQLTNASSNDFKTFAAPFLEELRKANWDLFRPVFTVETFEEIRPFYQVWNPDSPLVFYQLQHVISQKGYAEQIKVYHSENAFFDDYISECLRTNQPLRYVVNLNDNHWIAVKVLPSLQSSSAIIYDSKDWVATGSFSGLEYYTKAKSDLPKSGFEPLKKFLSGLGSAISLVSDGFTRRKAESFKLNNYFQITIQPSLREDCVAGAYPVVADKNKANVVLAGYHLLAAMKASLKVTEANGGVSLVIPKVASGSAYSSVESFNSLIVKGVWSDITGLAVGFARKMRGLRGATVEITVDGEKIDFSEEAVVYGGNELSSDLKSYISKRKAAKNPLYVVLPLLVDSRWIAVVVANNYTDVSIYDPVVRGNDAYSNDVNLMAFLTAIQESAAAAPQASRPASPRAAPVPASPVRPTTPRPGTETIAVEEFSKDPLGAALGLPEGSQIDPQGVMALVDAIDNQLYDLNRGAATGVAADEYARWTLIAKPAYEAQQ